MGTFSVAIEIAASPQGPFRPLDAMVDTGSLYTWLPASIAQELGTRPLGARRFMMADGSLIDREITNLYVRLGDRESYTICILDDEKSLNLLGAVTLEELGLTVDPVNQVLVPLPYIPALTLVPSN